MKLKITHEQSRNNPDTLDEVILVQYQSPATTIYLVEERINEGHTFSIARQHLDDDRDAAFRLFTDLADEIGCSPEIHTNPNC